MDDKEILQRIQRLVDEEHELYGRHSEDGLSADEESRLQELEVALDQCWDLLRQRRGRRHAGDDPNTADVRDAETVERYLQ